MKPLYAINFDIDRLTEELVDNDGVINEEILAELDKLEMDRRTKVENCLCAVVNLRAEAAAIRAQEKILSERRRRAETQADGILVYLSNQMEGERFESPRVSLSWRRSQAVEVDAGADLHWNEDQFFRFARQEVIVNKKALSEAMKAGEEIPGVRFVERVNPIVR